MPASMTAEQWDDLVKAGWTPPIDATPPVDELTRKRAAAYNIATGYPSIGERILAGEEIASSDLNMVKLAARWFVDPDKVIEDHQLPF
jgi:hypothetical protein